MKPIQTYNIVLADEDEDDYFFLKDILEETKQATLYRARNKQYLFQYLDSAAVPDAIFIGFSEHNNDVRECLRTIRNQPQYLSVPLIIYSDVINFSEMEDMYEIGANMYIRKPTSSEQLKLSMTHFINLFLKNYSA